MLIKNFQSTTDYELDGYGSFTLTETDSDTKSDSDSKPNGYIVLCKTFHIAQTRICFGQQSESVSGNVNEPLHCNMQDFTLHEVRFRFQF